MASLLATPAQVATGYDSHRPHFVAWCTRSSDTTRLWLPCMGVVFYSASWMMVNASKSALCSDCGSTGSIHLVHGVWSLGVVCRSRMGCCELHISGVAYQAAAQLKRSKDLVEGGRICSILCVSVGYRTNLVVADCPDDEPQALTEAELSSMPMSSIWLCAQHPR